METKPYNELTIPINIDNQGALKVIASGIIKAKTKHIELKFHHSHDEQKKKKVIFEYVKSEDNISDILTKGLGLPAHQVSASETVVFVF